MSQPPELCNFSGNWQVYEDELYQIYLDTVVHAGLRFQGVPVRAQYRPDTRAKGFSFWHLISEAPSKDNKNEEDRIPDFDRCARIRWVGWLINSMGNNGFSWWENKRGRDTHVVLWAEQHDFAVVLAKRHTQDGPKYYLLKTAYCLKPHRKKTFAKERDEFWQAKND